MNRVTVGKAARENGISRRTLQRWVRNGVIDRAPDGTVDPYAVAIRVGLRQSSDRRRGPKPGMGQGQFRLGKTRTGRHLSDFERADIIFGNLAKIRNPLVGVFVFNRLAEAVSRFAPAAATFSASSPSVAAPASAPAQ
jgi:hypothetical protein